MAITWANVCRRMVSLGPNELKTQHPIGGAPIGGREQMAEVFIIIPNMCMFHFVCQQFNSDIIIILDNILMMNTHGSLPVLKMNDLSDIFYIREVIFSTCSVKCYHHAIFISLLST